MYDALVEWTDKAQNHNTDGADRQCQQRHLVALDSNDRSVRVVDEHRLYHQQIVEERDDGVGQGQEHQQILALLGCGCKDEELAEESCKWRYATQREHGQHHHYRQTRIGGVETVVIVAVHFARLVLDVGNDTECGQIGKEVNQNVVNHAAHTIVSAGNHAQHDVASLRDRRKCEESFQIVLTDGEDVAHCDGDDNNPPNDILP